MKSIFILTLNKEIDLLQKWIGESRSGGWSTHLVDPMTRRRDELLNLKHQIEKIKRLKQC